MQGVCLCEGVRVCVCMHSILRLRKCVKVGRRWVCLSLFNQNADSPPWLLVTTPQPGFACSCLSPTSRLCLIGKCPVIYPQTMLAIQQQLIPGLWVTVLISFFHLCMCLSG